MVLDKKGCFPWRKKHITHPNLWSEKTSFAAGDRRKNKGLRLFCFFFSDGRKGLRRSTQSVQIARIKTNSVFFVVFHVMLLIQYSHGRKPKIILFSHPKNTADVMFALGKIQNKTIYKTTPDLRLFSFQHNKNLSRLFGRLAMTPATFQPNEQRRKYWALLHLIYLMTISWMAGT